jgi:hypothetical protein
MAAVTEVILVLVLAAVLAVIRVLVVMEILVAPDLLVAAVAVVVARMATGIAVDTCRTQVLAVVELIFLDKALMVLRGRLALAVAAVVEAPVAALAVLGH